MVGDEYIEEKEVDVGDNDVEKVSDEGIDKEYVNDEDIDEDIGDRLWWDGSMFVQGVFFSLDSVRGL